MAVIKKFTIIKFMQQFENVNSKLIRNISDCLTKIENGDWTIEDIKKIEFMFLELKSLPRDNDPKKWLTTYLQMKQLEIRYISAIPRMVGLV
jgi:hypothetical protein